MAPRLYVVARTLPTAPRYFGPVRSERLAREAVACLHALYPLGAQDPAARDPALAEVESLLAGDAAALGRLGLRLPEAIAEGRLEIDPAAADGPGRVPARRPRRAGPRPSRAAPGGGHRRAGARRGHRRGVLRRRGDRPQPHRARARGLARRRARRPRRGATGRAAPRGARARRARRGDDRRGPPARRRGDRVRPPRCPRAGARPRRCRGSRARSPSPARLGLAQPRLDHEGMRGPGAERALRGHGPPGRHGAAGMGRRPRGRAEDRGRPLGAGRVGASARVARRGRGPGLRPLRQRPGAGGRPGAGRAAGGRLEPRRGRRAPHRRPDG